jgi:hypothetical protein
MELSDGPENEEEIANLREAVDYFALIFSGPIIRKDKKFWKAMLGLFESRARAIVSEEPAND